MGQFEPELFLNSSLMMKLMKSALRLVKNLVLPPLNQALISNNRKTIIAQVTTSQLLFSHLVLKTGLSQDSVGEARAQPQHMSLQPDCNLLGKQAFGKHGYHVSFTKAAPEVPPATTEAEFC